MAGATGCSPMYRRFRRSGWRSRPLVSPGLWPRFRTTSLRPAEVPDWVGIVEIQALPRQHPLALGRRRGLQASRLPLSDLPALSAVGALCQATLSSLHTAPEPRSSPKEPRPALASDRPRPRPWTLLGSRRVAPWMKADGVTADLDGCLPPRPGGRLTYRPSVPCSPAGPLYF